MANEQALLDDLGGQLRAMGSGYEQMIAHQRGILMEMERLSQEIATAMAAAMGKCNSRTLSGKGLNRSCEVSRC